MSSVASSGDLQVHSGMQLPCFFRIAQGETIEVRVGYE